MHFSGNETLYDINTIGTKNVSREIAISCSDSGRSVRTFSKFECPNGSPDCTNEIFTNTGRGSVDIQSAINFDCKMSRLVENLKEVGTVAILVQTAQLTVFCKETGYSI